MRKFSAFPAWSVIWYESDTLNLDKTEFPAEDFLRRLLQTLETTLDQKKITAVIDADGCLFHADKDKMSQVVLNLVANAIKFTPEDGSIALTARQFPDGTHFTVSDTGAGIPPKDLPHVFERFYRADVSRNRTTGGSGIGLTLVKAIVEAHGGTITVSSEEGKGTTFSLTIPNRKAGS
jgi:two-component system sensor histidine kinase BaeS